MISLLPKRRGEKNKERRLSHPSIMAFCLSFFLFVGGGGLCGKKQVDPRKKPGRGEARWKCPLTFCEMEPTIMVPYDDGLDQQDILRGATKGDPKMITSIEHVDVEADCLYRYEGGGTYRVLRITQHVHSHQRLVIYEGVDGTDGGRTFAAPLFDWHRKFRRVEAPMPTNPPTFGFDGVVGKFFEGPLCGR